MATKKQLIDAAKKCGVTLTDEGDKLEVFCPTGKVLGGCDLHFVTYDTYAWTRPELYAEIIHDLSYGLKDCEADDCEPCGEPAIPFDVPPSSFLHRPEGMTQAS